MSENNCFHCGDTIIGKAIGFDQKDFCCNGCKSVYQILNENDLSNFYSIEQNAGTKPDTLSPHKYAFLNVEEIRNKFIDFEDENSMHLKLFLPSIHCSSCIYLLEHLNKIDQRVISCQVNFTKRVASIVVSNDLSISELSMLLDKIGYPPNFSDRKQHDKKRNNQYLIKLGIAGFAFGSIMLWSFPEYLGIENDNPEFRSFTSYLSFAMSIPVLVYSAREYLVSAFKAIRFKSLNLDVPISIGILALYAQSCYHIFAGYGPGYMDSFAGFIFFLLIGKWFQSKTYESLSFDRDYTSYFPVAVTKIVNDTEKIVEIEQIKIGDKLLIRNQEVIPCDVKLNSDNALIDYSFVTGESVLVKKNKGDTIFAGGKLIGAHSNFEVQKESSRSHLTQLWNESESEIVDRDKSSNQNTKASDSLSIYFLSGVLLIALISGISWFFIAPDRITEIVVSILIVACPCALALSKPFTYGNVMRILGRKGLYLKNAPVIEQMNHVSDIVFDKTGTLTQSSSGNIEYHGQQLSDEQMAKIIVLANSSTHPLSRALVNEFRNETSTNQIELSTFKEIEGKGILGELGGSSIKLGSRKFIDLSNMPISNNETATHLSIDGVYYGRFVFQSAFRKGIFDLLEKLSKTHNLHILSGDTTKDLSMFQENSPSVRYIHFEQSPQDKYDYISKLQAQGKKVLMIGDGLNDSGALKSANVGIAISEDIFRFSPSSNAIIKASKLVQIGEMLKTSKFAKRILSICYGFSILYNIIGLFFAITGNLTPLVAAILMPLSSISIVLISSALSTFRK